MTMNIQQAMRYGVRPETGRGVSIKIGACAIAIGLFYAVAHNSQQYAEVMPTDTKERIAVDTGELLNGPTRIQAVVDASPVFQSTLAIKPDLPATVIPTVKPVASPKHATSRADARQATAAGKMPSGVLRFDRCIPKCETQDPLIVGYTAPRQHSEEAPLIARNENDSGFNLSPLQGARYILTRTVDAPGAALRTGRDVIDSFVRAD